MRTNRTSFPLAACLLVVSSCLMGILVGWLLGSRYSNSRRATSFSQAAPDSIPIVEAVAPSPPARESLSVVSAEPPQPDPEIRQTIGSFALTNSESPINSQDLGQNREWARNFPGEAMAWLQNAPDSSQRLVVAEIVYPQLAQTNPAVAVALADHWLGGSTNAAAQYLLDNVAQQWASQDMRAASAWALAKPAGGQRDLLLQHIAFAESKADPYQAAQLVVNQISPGETQNEAAMSVVYQWAQQDATAALAWADSFPPGDLRDRAIKEVKNVSAVAVGNSPVN